MISFLTHLEPASPTVIEALNGEAACSPVLLPDVGEVRQHTLTDGEREAAIDLAASLIEYHTELYEISGCFTDRANADRARLSMEALIAGRSEAAKANAEGSIG